MTQHTALENITVLDLTRVLAGPLCGAMLGDMGANVIKIEIPNHGDDSRNYDPHINGESLYYANLNRNKIGITLNLKSEKGKEIFKELVKKADVLIENYRPGVMERLGLGYDELNKINDRLIYASLTGFGSYGPLSDRPGYDIISQAMGGLMSITGQPGSPPTRAGNAMGDVLGGLNMTIGVLAALNARTITGKGQRVDISLVDCVVASLEQAIQRYFVSGKVPERRGNSYEAIAPYDSYMAKDGYLVIGCGNQRLFEVLCRDILRDPSLIADERFSTVPLRVKNNKIFKEIIEEWAKDYTVEEAVEIVLEAGIPAAPIYDIKDIVENEHIANVREMFIDVDHPVIGKVKLNGNPVKLMDMMPSIRKPSPTLGQHNRDVYIGKLGLSEEEYNSLLKDGII
ncbi:MAG: CoA transferase [Clostridiales bacterium]|jgi:crotonobetainyl-CoA:carnitine CoA-transferase CaiB-like acyl-CoA transferase|nr:CoA transferase [Clostridiales bacterium]